MVSDLSSQLSLPDDAPVKKIRNRLHVIVAN